MYVRLGQVPSIVQPANPTPMNDAALYPRASQPQSDLRLVRLPVYRPLTAQIQPLPVPADVQPAGATATASATPPSLTAWLQTGNNGIYAAIAAAVLLILLTRRR